MPSTLEFGPPMNKACEAVSFSMGQQAPSLAGGGAQRAQVATLHFTKRADSFTAELMNLCYSGVTLENVRLSTRQSEKGPPVVVFTFAGATISSIQSGPDEGSGGSDHITLDSSSVSAKYFG